MTSLNFFSKRHYRGLCTLLWLTAMTTQAADYTYTVNRAGACDGCTGNLTATGTFTVNTLGAVTASNITNWSITIKSPGLPPTVLTVTDSSITHHAADLHATETEFYLATAPLSGSHEKFGVKANASNSEWIVSDDEGGMAPYEYFGNFTSSGNESSFLPIPEGPGNKVLIGVRQGGGGQVYTPPPPEEGGGGQVYTPPLPPPPPPEVRVSVEIDGPGEGSVSSNIGINCAASD